MAFIGESHPLYRAWWADGTDLPDSGEGIYYHFDGNSQTLVASDVIVAAIRPTPDQLTRDDEAVISWVVETGPASAGTVRLTAGDDPTWPLPQSDGLSLHEDLGAFTISGAKTIATGHVSLTVAQIVDWSTTPELRIEVTSGLVEVVQVKLRIWPPGGAAGAWVSAGIGSGVNTRSTHRDQLLPPSVGTSGSAEGNVDDWALYPDPDGAESVVMEAQRLATAQLGANIGQPGYFSRFAPGVTSGLASSDASAASTLFVLFSDPKEFYYTGAAKAVTRPGFMQADYATALPDLEGLAVSPYEIINEPEARMRPSGGGQLAATFDGWTSNAAFEVTYSTASGGGQWPSGPATVWQETLDSYPTEENPAYLVLAEGQSLPVAAPGTPGTDAVTQRVPILGGPILAVSVNVPGVTGPATSMDGLEDDAWFEYAVHKYEMVSHARLSIVNTEHRVLFGPVEVWDPAAVPPPAGRKPRFFVTYTEVDDDPRDVSHIVGIGKPADDLSIFRVPTPLGTLRELRHGEKVSDVSVCYPLKVKLEDGSWTVVAGMTPDA